MPLINELQENATTLVADRRRPGRVATVAPDLIPILRGDETVPLPEEKFEFPEEDQLSAAKGLLVGCVLSAPLWLCIAFVGRWLLH